MRTIRKEISTNGGATHSTMFHESYDNYMEFYETVMGRQSKARRTIDNVFNEHSADWLGCDSVEEAKQMFLNGWDKPLDRIKHSVNFDKACSTAEFQRPRPIQDVAGYQPIVPNALMGLPKSMINQRMAKRKAKVIRFMVSIDRAGHYDVDDITKKMCEAMSFIADVERSGIRTRLEVFFAGYGSNNIGDGKKKASCSILVKKETQPFDLKRLCYPIINPSMLRLLVFAWYESANVPMGNTEYWQGGYGTSFEYWSNEGKKAFVNAINELGEKTITIDMHSDFKKMADDINNGREVI